MKYDFTSVIERKGKDASAFDAVGVWGPPYSPTVPKEGWDFIPMWLADMNFATCPSVRRAMAERIEHPTFGYFLPRREYYASIIAWHEKQYGVTGLTPEHIGYENGVHGGNVTALRCICPRGGKVLLHTPAYSSFIRNLKELGYNAVLSPLKRDENGVWRMDFADMEKKIAAGNIHAAIFCSPHNPTGRVWERWEIERFMELCKKYDVHVISDEIWADITLDGHRHIPTQSVSDDAKMRTIAMYSITKTFNLAGLVGSYHIIYNKALRDRDAQESLLTHYNNMNVLSMYALIGAYSAEGCDWVEELRQVLSQNAAYACDYIDGRFTGVCAARPQGTYMLFLDCTEWCRAHGKTIDELQQAGWDVGVGWQDGRPFAGPCHIRMNLALPLPRVQEAFRRLDEHVFNR